MELKFICTYWGSENLSAKSFLHRAVSQGYDGVEINFPEDEAFVQEFVSELKNIRNTIAPDFSFIAQQVLSLKDESVSDYTRRMINRLEFLTTLSPDAINSHTGKDYYDWRDISLGGVKLSNTINKATNRTSPLRQNVARFPICLRRPLPEIPWPINGKSTCK
jgi:hypothetical protein